MYIYQKQNKRSAFTYVFIKNFAWEDQRLKQCYISHIALLGVNSAI